MNTISMHNIKIKTFFFFALILLTQDAMAADGDPNTLSRVWLYMLIGMAFFVLAWTINVILSVIDALIRTNEFTKGGEHGLEEYLKDRDANEGPSIWDRISDILTDRVPLEKEKDILMDHNYDGIRELDNNLPPWWVYGFYLTIFIAVVYMGYYHFSDYGQSSTEQYEFEMEKAEEAVAAYLATQANQVDESNVTELNDEASLAEGKAIFNLNCVACHLESGGGSPISVGPNLTDAYWIHGGGIVNVFKTIKYGVPEKGMIAWQTQLNPSDMQKVSSYVLSLQGTDPPNAKGPQGELYVAENQSAEVPE